MENQGFKKISQVLAKNSGIILFSIAIIFSLISALFYDRVPNTIYFACVFSGMWIGWQVLKFSIRYLNDIDQSESVSKKNKLLSMINSKLRELIFEYNARKKTRSFILDFLKGKNRIMQITHRSHFVELCRDEDDFDFGLALYVPFEILNQNQSDDLQKIIKNFSNGSNIGKDYLVVDLGTRADIASEFIDKLLRKVFNVHNVSEIVLMLEDDGNLYIAKNPDPSYWLRFASDSITHLN